MRLYFQKRNKITKFATLLRQAAIIHNYLKIKRKGDEKS